jgi:ABC-2 type transport system permease protein
VRDGVQQIALEIVELYPYVEYMKYLLAGAVALAMYVAVMTGGGMRYIDDKQEAYTRDTW